jgi:hypothetical protein
VDVPHLSELHLLRADFATLGTLDHIGTLCWPLVLWAKPLILLVDDFVRVPAKLTGKPEDNSQRDGND